ncbi:hypothetical protein OUZ56_017934 [Daphnia magna]|uniref:Uncharacterized protein n=1 Tax=Daphnia magna TaxID=35525 RepID=A0ABR0ATZ1_9CRUS|nr:hypothetical protein OUZ56_017934 [Daphnia magna]
MSSEDISYLLTYASSSDESHSPSPGKEEEDYGDGRKGSNEKIIQKKKKKDAEKPPTVTSCKSSSASKVNIDQREKALLALQFKILDIGRPLLFLGSRLEDPECIEALETALQLWGVAFNDITKSRRRNILRQTDPKMESLLEDQDNFEFSESNHLFGRHFLKAMVRTAVDEAKLNAAGRNNGSSTSRHRRDSRGSTDQRKDRHPSRNQFDKGYG